MNTALGFTVAELAPVGSAPGGLKMGLRRVPEPDWLQREFDRSARATVFDAHPGRRARATRSRAHRP